MIYKLFFNMLKFIINKARITDINNNNLLLYNWNNGIIEIKDIQNWKEYKILYLYHNDDLYLRPFYKIECKCFEDLFGFNYNSDNYSSTKIIKINSYE